MHLRKTLLQAGTQVQEVLKWQVRMQSADNVEFCDCLGISRGSGFESLFQRHGVGAGRILLAAKGAEAARGDAHVGGIDMADDVWGSFLSIEQRSRATCDPPARTQMTRSDTAT